jgi:hypothetical protein
MDANFTCLEQRLDNITANGEQKVGTIGIAEDDFDVAAIEESGLCECVFQRVIDRSQFSVAEY